MDRNEKNRRSRGSAPRLRVVRRAPVFVEEHEPARDECVEDRPSRIVDFIRQIGIDTWPLVQIFFWSYWMLGLLFSLVCLSKEGFMACLIAWAAAKGWKRFLDGHE